MKKKMKKNRMILGMLALALCVGGTGITAYGAEAAEEENIIEEGYREEGEGYTSVVSWCKNGEKNIFGKFYYPADFDESKTYPTVILSHGLSVTHEIYDKTGWVKVLTEQGYVCYTFDFCGGSIKSLSDLTFEEMSVMTEKEDLNAVMDFVKEKSFCRQDQLYLMGQSQGGFVSALAAAERSEEIAGMILLYPAFCIVDNVHNAYASKEEIPEDKATLANGEFGAGYAKDVYDIDTMEAISGYTGDVLLIHGVNDQSVSYSYSVEALEEAYSESASELVLIAGKDSIHAFDIFYQEGQKQAYDAAIDYLKVHINAGEETE